MADKEAQLLVPLTYAEVDAILDKIVVTPPSTVTELVEPDSPKVKMHHALFEKFMKIRRELESLIKEEKKES